MNKTMPRLGLKGALTLVATLALGACMSTGPTRPAGWQPPEALVQPSAFAGVHGLAVDAKGRLFAGTVLGSSLWEVDRRSGAAKVAVAAPEGQSDDIAIGPNGAMAWTNYMMGALRYRAGDGAPMQVLAKDLPGLNSVDFDRRNGRLYASQVFLGDALWEIDVRGQQAPRLIARDLGGFNGFEVGPDGMLYGPLWFKGQVVKIDPANGRVTVINDQFKTPAAANLDGKGNLWVVDTRTGELARVELSTGRKTVAAQLKPALDNLAIAPDDGTIYVSNMADNSVQAFNPATGEVRTLLAGKVAVPAGLKVSDGQLWVADVFSLRRVDLANGAVNDVFRMQASEMEYPFGIGIDAKTVALTSWFTGTLQIIDRTTLATRKMLHKLKAPMDAQPQADGSMLVLEMGSGELSRLSGADWGERRVIAGGLTGPVQMAADGQGRVYVTQADGQLLRINLADGQRTVVARDLALPEGVAVTPWGSVVVAEAAARRVTEIDPASGARRPVATDLPIGLEPSPGLPATFVPTGLAVDPAGNLYLSADRNNAIYRIRPQTRAAGS